MLDTSKNKLLFLIHLPPPIHGAGIAGSNIKASKLLNETFSNSFINISVSKNIKSHSKLTLRKFFLIISVYFRVISFLLYNKIDLCLISINSKGSAWLKELLLVFFVKLFKVPIIYFYNNKGVRSNSYNFFKKKLYEFQFKNTKSILLSPLLYYDLSTFVKKTDVFYCPYGLINNSVKNNNYAFKKSEVVTILFFSNLIESKGVFVLLDACKILMKKNISFRCNFAGSEGDITSIQFEDKVWQMGLQNHVYYLGKKYDFEKEIIFQEADIFAFPTFYHNETFGLVNLEAMQCSLPIISTNEGAIADIVIDGINGYLVPQRNVEILAEKLEILTLNPELRNEMGRAGKRMFDEKFTFEIFEKRIVEILQEVLTNKIA